MSFDPWTAIPAAEFLQRQDRARRAAAAAGLDGLAGRRGSLVGSGCMTAAAYLGLREAAGDTELVIVDDLIERLRVDKSPAELALIRRSVAIGDRAVEAMMDAAVAGATEADAASTAVEVVTGAGAVLYDAACASGPNSHHFTWARLPSHDAVRPLRRASCSTSTATAPTAATSGTSGAPA